MVPMRRSARPVGSLLHPTSRLPPLATLSILSDLPNYHTTNSTTARGAC